MARHGTGSSTANTLRGTAGADFLDGGAGVDTLIGGDGNDTYYTDTALDVVTETTGKGNDTVVASVEWVLGANLEGLTLTGAAHNGMGNGLANTMVGTALADTLDGAGGIDTMTGGAGDDTYKVDNTLDVVVELAGGGKDTVSVSGTLTVVLGDAGQIVYNVSADGSKTTVRSVKATALGTGDSDSLTVRGGMAVILGGEGTDTITTPASETKAVVLGDLGEARFDDAGLLTVIQVSAANSPDAYRVDDGLASASLQLLGDVRIWIGRDSGGNLLRTHVSFVDGVSLDGHQLNLVFQAGFKHEVDRKEGEETTILSGILGKLQGATGLFRGGDLTYDLVEILIKVRAF
jgi:Ca2+-binding RTX toxin-like protein